MTFDVGPFALHGTIPDANDGMGGFCSRRTVLDALLVNAAAESGAEVREGFTVDELLVADHTYIGIRGHAKGMNSVEERARIVIGADSVNSLVARTCERPSMTCNRSQPVPTTRTSAACAKREGGSGNGEFDEPLAAHELTWNERVRPMYEFTTHLAALEPPPPDMRALFGALRHNQDATNAFLSAITGAIPLSDFNIEVYGRTPSERFRRLSR
jgi:2-polyprenyl-6-methoxyphenol hydroxylase-like FAD-dependent oxidoreductase